MQPIRIHLVDDSHSILMSARDALEERAGGMDRDSGVQIPLMSVETFGTVQSWRVANRPSSVRPPAICLFDVAMNGDDDAGFALATFARERFPEAVIVMFSGYDDVDTILRFREAGADGFISKKTDMDALAGELTQLYQLSLRRRVTGATALLASGVFAGKTFEAIARRVPQILASALRAVHVTGETGTGKEVVADLFEGAQKAVSPKKPFLRLNCGAITLSLLESELFGHAKGAFTGAQSERVGVLESASGGWVFLDEVASLSLAAQGALLRAVENQEIMRVGESKARRIDVRVLSACNENLKEKVARGEFRRDLWQRLTETSIPLPPLRERKDEIPALVEHFCSKLNAHESSPAKPYTVTPAALELLVQYDYGAGNVRELRNCLRAMTEDAASRILGPNSVPSSLFDSLLAQRKRARMVERSSKVSFSLEGEAVPYADFEETLFIETARFLLKKNSIASLRGLERATGLPRMTLSRRLRAAVQSGRISQSEFPERFWERNKMSHDESGGN
jgi:DNA-binding NtrC family response regulator